MICWIITVFWQKIEIVRRRGNIVINFHDISSLFVLLFIYNDDTMIMNYEPFTFLFFLIVD